MPGELADGVYLKLWDEVIADYTNSGPRTGNLQAFFQQRWTAESFEYYITLLERQRYANWDKTDTWQITPEAFDLVDETEPHNIFISYKRSESSMLALLVNNTLRLKHFAPYFDMLLSPTEEWHARLEKQVKTSEYFVALLGPQTHDSKYTVREIYWAFEHKIPIVQLWHHGYTLEPNKWQNCEHPEVAIILPPTTGYRNQDGRC